MRRKALAALVPFLAALALVGPPADADPVRSKNAFTIPVTCDGQTFQVVVNGNGRFTPAHVVGTNQNFVPVSFGQTTFTVRNSQGQVIVSETEPPETKGRGRAGQSRELVTCSFNFTQPVSPEDAGEFPPGAATFTVSGTVTGFFTPAR